MARFSEQSGVYFTEDTLQMSVLGEIAAVAPTQNSNLTDVKKMLAIEAQKLGGNGVIDFKYSQKADSPLKILFSFRWDTERLRASGKVVKFEVDPRG